MTEERRPNRNGFSF